MTVRLYDTVSRDPLTTSLHAGDTRQSYVILKLVTEGGHTGYGEAPSVPFITGETSDTMVIALRDHLVPALIGHDIRDMRGLHEAMRRVFPHGNRAAFSAVDIAAHDALGRALGVPVSVLLGGVPGGPVATSRAIGTGPVPDMVAAARRNIEAGYTTIKVKVGSDAERELAALRAIREENGPDFRLKIDANQGWTAGEALRFLDKAARHDVFVVEQPLAAGDIAGHADLRRRSSIPVMLDESIHGPDDAFRAIAAGACDYINIKLPKAGGLYPAAQIAAIAAAAGVVCQIGSLSTTIGTAAAIHLIHAHPVIALPEINWPDRLARNPAEGFVLQRGLASIPEEAGLGVAVAMDMEHA
ncbi:mandelate racemase/muconate lactonizing enzyme family protein [Bosea sp. (in: a-proteobacteria)]|uniref:mandelate racemase/muconate lactonizing enzyme family protein n=1 Tax=Bosea sp. (in: a-proteobacteria) TaxID=1871050 RepID=UPI002627C737|nr:dipeptide epimerase [Bosea sp. (in: a-proteobacteria)]MCO5093129.1 dipeptide epimerase [Bosea sp. (in: a-proteobacteria)]